MNISAIATALRESILTNDGTNTDPSYTDGWNDGIEHAARLLGLQLEEMYPGFSFDHFLTEVGINPESPVEVGGHEKVVVNEDVDDLIEEAYYAMRGVIPDLTYLEQRQGGGDPDLDRLVRSMEQLRRWLYTPQDQRESVYGGES